MNGNDPDKARRIMPKNAVRGVVELNSNFTAYIAEVNPDTAGDDVTPVECGTVAEVAEAFKPKINFELKKLNNIGGDEVSEEVITADMCYGEIPKDIMNDFSSENLMVKMKNSEGERPLLDQQLTYHALDDLMERLKDKKFESLFTSNKQGMIDAIEAEIERMQDLVNKAEANKFSDD